MLNIFNIIKSSIYIVEGYAKWLWDIIRGDASPKSIHRYRICSKCENNIHGICAKCGCIIKAKVRVDFDTDNEGISIDGCPEKKW